MNELRKVSTFYLVIRCFLLLGATLLWSCEEVIELELDSIEKQIVVEANLDAGEGVCVVIVSQSSDFYEANTFQSVSDVKITLSTLNGDSYLLAETTPGYYEIDNIIADPGDNFLLQLELPEGQVYEAQATVPTSVSLDTLLVEEGSGGFGGPMGEREGNYQVTIEWADTPGEGNAYRARIFRNEVFQPDVYVLTTDVLGDGGTMSRPILQQSYEQGDIVKVELRSVSQSYYDYFNAIANSEGRGLSAPTPFNPIGNFGAEILGYFGAWYSDEASVIIQ